MPSIRNPQSAIRNQTPSFFWQGTLILLPVLVLAVVGLISLRQDEQAAETDARKRVGADSENLARAISDTAGEDLQQYFGLQKSWGIDLQAALITANPVFPTENTRSAVAKWEQTYPGFKFAAMTSAECEVLADGREIDPPSVPAKPVPPEWYRDLSPKQREIWEEIRQGQTVEQEFLNTAPTAEGRAALQSVLQALHQPADQNEDSSLLLTDSGISFQDLACYQLLNGREPLSLKAINALSRRLFDKPSFLSSALLECAESHTNGADSQARQRLHWLRLRWDAECAARGYLEPLRDLRQFRSGATNLCWAQWSQTPSRRALGLFMPCLFRDYVGTDDGNGNRSSGRGWIVSFIPEEVVNAIFARAFAGNKSLVPDFALPALSVENEPLSLSGIAANVGNKQLLASTSRIVALPTFFPNSVGFRISYYLTSREKMLAAEQHRIRLFGALIGAAVLAALAGLVAARRAFYEQHRLSEMKTNFVSSVSHELRAPIASIRLLAEGLDRGKIAEAGKKQEYYRFLVQESRRLTSLIENVLDFSRIDQGRQDYRFEPTDLEAIVEQTIQLMRPGAEEKQVNLVWQRNSEAPNAKHQSATPPREGKSRAGQPVHDVHAVHSVHAVPLPIPATPPAVPICPGWPVIHCDGLAIQQALINLIDNAIKHSPVGAKVEVGLEANGEAAQIWVEDHGPGIPPEEHQKIFQRFYRRGSELRRETQGIGIGLTIVKHIIEAHSGKVTVRSAVGQGSRFTIELPAPGTPPSGGSDDPKGDV